MSDVWFFSFDVLRPCLLLFDLGSDTGTQIQTQKDAQVFPGEDTCSMSELICVPSAAEQTEMIPARLLLRLRSWLQTALHGIFHSLQALSICSEQKKLAFHLGFLFLDHHPMLIEFVGFWWHKNWWSLPLSKRIFSNQMRAVPWKSFCMLNTPQPEKVHEYLVLLIEPSPGTYCSYHLP